MSFSVVMAALLAVVAVILSAALIRLRSTTARWIEEAEETLARFSDDTDHSARIQESPIRFQGLERRINQILDNKGNLVRDVTQLLQQFNPSEDGAKMLDEHPGDIASLRNSVSQATTDVKQSLSLLQQIVDAIGSANYSLLQGAEIEHNLGNRVNDAMGQFSEMLEQITSLMQRVARGDFTQRITIDAQGDLLQLKEVINHCMAEVERAIAATTNGITRIGDGNFTEELEGEFIGQLSSLTDAVNAMQRNLSHIVFKVRTTAATVHGEAETLSQETDSLSRRTGQQAAALEESSASMEEMNGTVDLNASHAEKAERLAHQARDEARRGTEVVREAVAAMSRINESSDKISEIIALIDGIAFQTNLLALNAAVEAARAGDHGRGFAVVAGEVRSLAQRSADAAKEIATLISETGERISEGNRLVNRSGENLQMIEESVNKVATVANEISSAAKEQGIGISQVNRAIAEIDEVNQQNAHLVSDAANSAATLQEQAGALSSLMEIFTLNPATTQQSGQHRVLTQEIVVLDKARSAHLAWKGKIRGFLDGFIEMNVKQAVSHHDCVLGKWLDSEGREKYSHFREMQSLDEVHAKMHAVVKQVIKLKHEGKIEEAEQEFLKISPYSTEVVGYLDQMENELM